MSLHGDLEFDLAAGAFTVGVACGNALGLSLDAFDALSPSARSNRLAAARGMPHDAGADLVIDSVADLVVALEADGT